jgi:hypothetical protein
MVSACDATTTKTQQASIRKDLSQQKIDNASSSTAQTMGTRYVGRQDAIKQAVGAFEAPPPRRAKR